MTSKRINTGWWNLGVGALYNNPGQVRMWEESCCLKEHSTVCGCRWFGSDVCFGRWRNATDGDVFQWDWSLPPAVFHHADLDVTGWIIPSRHHVRCLRPRNCLKSVPPGQYPHDGWPDHGKLPANHGKLPDGRPGKSFPDGPGRLAEFTAKRPTLSPRQSAATFSGHFPPGRHETGILSRFGVRGSPRPTGRKFACLTLPVMDDKMNGHPSGVTVPCKEQ